MWVRERKKVVKQINCARTKSNRKWHLTLFFSPHIWRHIWLHFARPTPQTHRHTYVGRPVIQTFISDQNQTHWYRFAAARYIRRRNKKRKNKHETFGGRNRRLVQQGNGVWNSIRSLIGQAVYKNNAPIRVNTQIRQKYGSSRIQKTNIKKPSKKPRELYRT